MILVLKSDLTDEGRHRLLELARSAGRSTRLVEDEVEGRRLLVVEPRGERPDPDLRARAALWPGVERVLCFDEVYPRCRTAPSEIVLEPRRAGTPRLRIGPGHLVWVAGPCAVEDPDGLCETASAVARAGASMLRGGAYKPRTSPYSFQGTGREGLLLLAAVARDHGLPVVTEVIDPRDVDFVAQHVDLLQIGSRSMQSFPLLREAGASGRPVLLKRGGGASLEEFLGAAEYVLEAGCPGLILCERGVRGFDPGRRNVLDLAIVPALRERTGMPVFVDPSHATGRRSLVIPLAKAAVAAGADGVLVEVHSRPEEALSDAGQALWTSDLEALSHGLRAVARLEGRTVPAGPCAAPEDRPVMPADRRQAAEATRAGESKQNG